MNDMRDALEAIVIRCKEGDKKFNWLPTITDIAQRALASQPSPAATVETVEAGPSNWRELEACPVAAPHLSAGNAGCGTPGCTDPNCDYGKGPLRCQSCGAVVVGEPQEAPTREDVAAAIRKALVENWYNADTCERWNEDILLTGCCKAGGKYGYQKPWQAAQNLALDAADAALALSRPLLCAHGVKIGNTCVGCMGAASLPSHQLGTEND